MNNFTKLFLFFFIAVALVSFVITPILMNAFDANRDTISELQAQSQQLGNAENITPETLQQIITEGAKKIKSQITRADYLFIYCSQIAYNILCFLISALLFRKIAFSKQSRNKDWTKTNVILYFLTPFLLLSSLPIIGESLHLNDWLGINWLIEQSGFNLNEGSVGNMIFSYAVFVPETSIQLFTSIIFVAIVPAIGEELFFRGSLQKTLTPHLGNIHNTIFVTALIFSALHFEITAFFYRFFLGVILGYVFHWTKNLLIPILIHALNNGMTIFTMYYSYNATLSETPTEVASDTAYALILSSASAGIMLWIYYAHFKKHELESTE
ncbi:MAG: membrane protease YdiL (CAAX protease family) [Saprospiraceae bacterium]|jgi:membrane protease YdiL (CAAX protease family)